MQYPSLTKLVNEIFYGHGFHCAKLRPNPVWPSNAAQLNDEASRLTEDEMQDFAYGLNTDQEAVTIKYGIQALHEFAEQVFDGDLTETFIDLHPNQHKEWT